MGVLRQREGEPKYEWVEKLHWVDRKKVEYVEEASRVVPGKEGTVSEVPDDDRA